MLTFFTIAKPFYGKIEVVQRNAITSWLRLRPACEVILVGDDAGTAEAAAELGVRHVPEVERSQHGTPLLNSVFELAERSASEPLLCYLNADIILLPGFMDVVQLADEYSRFVITGQRWEVDVNQTIDFSQESSIADLRRHTLKHGVLDPLWMMDFFVYPRERLSMRIPPLLVGRGRTDNWLVYQARVANADLIDVTPSTMVIHQSHDYSHIGRKGSVSWKGEEGEQNKRMVAETGRIYSLLDATHIATPPGSKEALVRTPAFRSPKAMSLAEYRRVLETVFEGAPSEFCPVYQQMLASSFWHEAQLSWLRREHTTALRKMARAHRVLPKAYTWRRISRALTAAIRVGELYPIGF